jgi:hypothetical protein
MTVVRHFDGLFDAPLVTVANGVRAVLVKKPPYRNTIEVAKDTLFKTNVKPSWWLMGTNMTIKLQPSSDRTQVVVETRPQWFITGDIFGCYNRYIRDFLRDLQNQI